MYPEKSHPPHLSYLYAPAEKEPAWHCSADHQEKVSELKLIYEYRFRRPFLEIDSRRIEPSKRNTYLALETLRNAGVHFGIWSKQLEILLNENNISEKSWQSIAKLISNTYKEHPEIGWVLLRRYILPKFEKTEAQKSQALLLWHKNFPSREVIGKSVSSFRDHRVKLKHFESLLSIYGEGNDFLEMLRVGLNHFSRNPETSDDFVEVLSKNQSNGSGTKAIIQQLDKTILDIAKKEDHKLFLKYSQLAKALYSEAQINKALYLNSKTLAQFPSQADFMRLFITVFEIPGDVVNIVNQIIFWKRKFGKFPFY